jgi:membrane-associated phospholipid phosphatase
MASIERAAARLDRLTAVFDTGPNLWLQSWASPWLTTAMNVVSILGYSHCCLAGAALVTFGWKRRAGLALFVSVAFTAALVSLAKGAWASPRPDAVDPRVQTLTVRQLRPAPDVAPRADDEDRFGFPSGHVAVTTALLVGVGVLVRRRWMWVAAAAGVVLMGLSRMYLGRHFLGDVLGGAALGAIAFALGWYWLRLRSLALDELDDRPPVHAGLLLIAAVAVALSLLVAIPSAYDAGRLAGVALATIVVIRSSAGEAGGVLPRLAALLLSLILIGAAVAWDVVPHLITGGAATARTVRLVVTAALNGAAVGAPLAALRLNRS